MIFSNYNGRNYKIILKNIVNTDEIFIVSMIWLSSDLKALKKELKRTKAQAVKN